MSVFFVQIYIYIYYIYIKRIDSPFFQEKRGGGIDGPSLPPFSFLLSLVSCK